MSRISEEVIQAEVDRILAIFQADFEDCYPLMKRFSNLPMDAGIYALRDRAAILYIGKTSNIRTRFQSGHKCLSDSLIDERMARDLRIAAAPVVPIELVRELERIEGRLLLLVRPPYNVLYPTREV
ncbi:MAG: GIY-YIG nuclease family protein [Alkalinema sp. RL_2_19]|nr:GIY-YIG nuclease family protein [Alkalinema sp. RL_2_19]